MTHVFHRSPSNPLPVAVSGSGAYVIDDSGKRYIDACGGAAVSCIGHGDGRVREAVQRQMADISYAHTSFFTSPAAEMYAVPSKSTNRGNLCSMMTNNRL